MRTIGVDTLALSAVAVSHHSLAALLKSFTNQPHPPLSPPVPARSGSLRFAAAPFPGPGAGCELRHGVLNRPGDCSGLAPGVGAELAPGPAAADQRLDAARGHRPRDQVPLA